MDSKFKLYIVYTEDKPEGTSETEQQDQKRERRDYGDGDDESYTEGTWWNENAVLISFNHNTTKSFLHADYRTFREQPTVKSVSHYRRQVGLNGIKICTLGNIQACVLRMF